MRGSTLTYQGLPCKSRFVPVFDCLGDPVRRRVLGPCIDGERAANEIGAVTQEKFRIAQSQVSDSRPTGPQRPTREHRDPAD
jgi:hypothetical protein